MFRIHKKESNRGKRVYVQIPFSWLSWCELCRCKKLNLSVQVERAVFNQLSHSGHGTELRTFFIGFLSVRDRGHLDSFLIPGGK